MVALESPAATDLEKPSRARTGFGWTLAAGGVLLVGLGIRFVLDGGGVGDRSAIVMATLLSVGAWLATRLLASPRTAFLVTLGVVALLDIAALPTRNAPEYDDREAFYRTDQVISAQVPSPPPAVPAQPTLVLLVEPVFASGVTQSPFGLAGDVGGTTAVWDCAFTRGLQHLALPLPAGAVPGPGPIDVRLHLTGSPSRDTAYLLVYASAPRGGFLVSLVGASDLSPGTTVCKLAP